MDVKKVYDAETQAHIDFLNMHIDERIKTLIAVALDNGEQSHQARALIDNDGLLHHLRKALADLHATSAPKLRVTMKVKGNLWLQ